MFTILEVLPDNEERYFLPLSVLLIMLEYTDLKKYIYYFYTKIITSPNGVYFMWTC